MKRLSDQEINIIDPIACKIIEALQQRFPNDTTHDSMMMVNCLVSSIHLIAMGFHFPSDKVRFIEDVMEALKANIMENEK